MMGGSDSRQWGRKRKLQRKFSDSPHTSWVSDEEAPVWIPTQPENQFQSYASFDNSFQTSPASVINAYNNQQAFNSSNNSDSWNFVENYCLSSQFVNSYSQSHYGQNDYGYQRNNSFDNLYSPARRNSFNNNTFSFGYSQSPQYVNNYRSNSLVDLSRGSLYDSRASGGYYSNAYHGSYPQLNNYNSNSYFSLDSLPTNEFQSFSSPSSNSSYSYCRGKKCYSGDSSFEDYNQNACDSKDEDVFLKPRAKRIRLSSSNLNNNTILSGKEVPPKKLSVNKLSQPKAEPVLQSEKDTLNENESKSKVTNEKNVGVSTEDKVHVKLYPKDFVSKSYNQTAYIDIPLTTSQEGIGLCKYFQKTSKSKNFHLRILSITKVENPFLHSLYLLKKEEMKRQYSRVDELFLYHGTKKENLDQICEDNLNWRLYRANHHRFGKGISFSHQATYSSHYSDNSSVKFMFLFKVLVGNAVLGNSEMVIPPSKDGIKFDTSIKEDAAVIVKYKDNEFYPLYRIKYMKHCY